MAIRSRGQDRRVGPGAARRQRFLGVLSRLGHSKRLTRMLSRFREVLDGKETGNYYASSRRDDER